MWVVPAFDKVEDGERTAEEALADTKAREDSAVRVVETVIAARHDLHEAHIAELLSVAAWMFTEAGGKYTTRYATSAARDSSIALRHEHVIPRKLLRDEMLKHPEHAGEILRMGVACVVTQDEHLKLSPDKFGWDRYEDANLKVYDRVENRFVELKLLAQKLGHKWQRLTSG